MSKRVAIPFVRGDDRPYDRGLHGCQDWCGDSCDDWPGGPIVFPPVSEAWAAYGVECNVETGKTGNSRGSDRVFHGCQDWSKGSCDDWPTNGVERARQTGTTGGNQPSDGFFHPCQDWPGDKRPYWPET